MLHAGCPENRDLLTAPPDLASLNNVVVGRTDGKAEINLADGAIVIDGDYLRSLDSEDSVAATLYHELAHKQVSGCARQCDGKPQGCERCADNRAGACMALAGYDRNAAVKAFNGMKLKRKTAVPDAILGFDYAYNNTRQLQAPVMTQAPSFRLPPPTQTQAPTIPSTPPITQKPLPLNPSPVDGGDTKAPVVNSACAYDYEWVVGVFGGVSVLTILVMRWAVGK